MKNSRKYPRTFRPKESVQVAPQLAESVDVFEPLAAEKNNLYLSIDSELYVQPLIRRSMFWPPAYLGETWNEYIPLAFWAVDALKPKMIAEVGGISPVSFFALCQAVRQSALDARCIAVDTRGSSVSDPLFEEIDFYSKQHYGSFSSVIQHQFEHADSLFDADSIDLLHLDLLNVPDAQLDNNFDRWVSLLSDNGIMLLSGTGIQSKKPQIRKLIASLRDRYPIFEMAQGQGVSIVGVGEQLNEPFSTLFSADEEAGDKQAIREAFSRIGQSCCDAWVVKKLNRQLDNLQKEKEQKAKEVDELKIFSARSNSDYQKAIDAVKANFQPELDVMRKQATVMEEELLQSRKIASEYSLKVNTLEVQLKRLEGAKERQTREIVLLTKMLLQAEEGLEQIQENDSVKTSSVSKNPVQQQPLMQEKKSAKLPNFLRVLGGTARGVRKEKDGDAKLLHAKKLLLDSALFDEKWYLNRYPDAATSNISSVEHYLTVGAALGYDPSANFDSSYYLEKNKDVAISGMNPLVHYLRFGISENRKPKAN